MVQFLSADKSSKYQPNYLSKYLSNHLPKYHPNYLPKYIPNGHIQRICLFGDARNWSVCNQTNFSQRKQRGCVVHGGRNSCLSVARPMVVCADEGNCSFGHEIIGFSVTRHIVLCANKGIAVFTMNEICPSATRQSIVCANNGIVFWQRIKLVFL